MNSRTSTTSSSINTTARLLAIPLAGTGSINQGSVSLTGASTTFVNQVRGGDWITINGEQLQVGTVTSNTVLTFRTPLVQANLTGQAMTLFPAEGFRSGIEFPVYIKSRSTNTDVIFVGVSSNPSRDGTDLSPTSKMFSLAIGECSPVIFARDLRNYYTQSVTASQRFDVIID